MLGMVLQRFELVDHLDYQLKTKTALTVKPDDFHIQVRPRTGVRLDRDTRRPPQPAPATAAAAPAAGRRRPGGQARHPAVGAVRLEPGHRRVDRHPARRRGHRARLRRHPGPARRPRRRPAPRPRRGARGLLVLQRDPAGQRGEVLPLDRPTPTPTASRSPCSAAAAPSGRPPTRRCRPGWTTSSPPAAGAGCTPAARATRPATSTPPTGRWHEGLWSDLAAALDLPAEVAAAAPAGPRLSLTLTNRQLTNPVIMSYQARPALVRANRELIRRRRRAPPGTWRSRCRPGCPTRPATTWGCCRATGSSWSAGCWPGSGSTPGSTSRSFRTAARTPTCRSTNRPRCSACWAAAWSCRTSPPGTTSPRWPGTPTTPAAAGRAARRSARTTTGYQQGGVRGQPLGAGPARGVPGLRAAVRRVPRHAAAAAPALLLDLVLAAGQPGRLQHHQPAC